MATGCARWSVSAGVAAPLSGVGVSAIGSSALRNEVTMDRVFPPADRPRSVGRGVAQGVDLDHPPCYRRHMKRRGKASPCVTASGLAAMLVAGGCASSDPSTQGGPEGSVGGGPPHVLRVEETETGRPTELHGWIIEVSPAPESRVVICDRSGDAWRLAVAEDLWATYGMDEAHLRDHMTELWPILATVKIDSDGGLYAVRLEDGPHLNGRPSC